MGGGEGEPRGLRSRICVMVHLASVCGAVNLCMDSPWESASFTLVVLSKVKSMQSESCFFSDFATPMSFVVSGISLCLPM